MLCTYILRRTLSTIFGTQLILDQCHWFRDWNFKNLFHTCCFLNFALRAVGKKPKENLRSPQAAILCPYESRASDSSDRKSGPLGLREAAARNVEVEPKRETAWERGQSVTLEPWAAGKCSPAPFHAQSSSSECSTPASIDQACSDLNFKQPTILFSPHHPWKLTIMDFTGLRAFGSHTRFAQSLHKEKGSRCKLN